MELSWKSMLEDARQFNSPSATLFYVYLVHHCEPFKRTKFITRNIGREVGISHPYSLIGKMVDAGLMARTSNRLHGTTLMLLKDYRNGNESTTE